MHIADAWFSIWTQVAQFCPQEPVDEAGSAVQLKFDSIYPEGQDVQLVGVPELHVMQGKVQLVQVPATLL